MISIAIDGPAGAGKSSISKGISKRLGYIYVDTGALYRATAYTLNKNGTKPKNDTALESALKNVEVDIKFIDNEQHVYVNGEDVSDKIRTPEVSMLASSYSALPAVRAFLLGLQRGLAKKHNVIMDGRDIGTVVLPDASLKIYLTAKAENRAERRYKELVEKGVKADYNEVLADIKQRDYNDMHRDVAPLKQADDAVLVDNTGNNLEQSIEQMLEVIKQKLNVEAAD